MTPLARLLAGLLLTASVLAGALGLTAGPAAACGCAEPPARALEDAAVVFSGSVQRESALDQEKVFTVAVDRVHRGTAHRLQDVVTPEHESACGLPWRVGDEVIAAGDADGEAVRAGLCGGSMTARLDQATYDKALERLGAGEAPAPGEGKAERAGLTYDQWKVGRFVMGLIGLSLMAVVAVRVLRGRLARRRASEGA